MRDEERRLRKDAIGATRDGWARYVRERVTDVAALRAALTRAENDAIMMMGTMPLADLVSLFDSREQMEQLAYAAALCGPIGRHLIGAAYQPN